MALSVELLNIFYSFFKMLSSPPTPTLFPYTTLFRSVHDLAQRIQPKLRAEDGPPHARQFVEIAAVGRGARSEEHTSELQSLTNLVCRLLLEKKKKKKIHQRNQCTSTVKDQYY